MAKTGKPIGKQDETKTTTNAPPAANTGRAVAMNGPAGGGAVNLFGKKAPLLRPDVQGSNYVQFLNQKSKKRGEVLEALKIKSKDFREDTPILHTITGPVMLDPFRFWMSPHYFQHFSEVDKEYNILSSIMGVDDKPGGNYQENNEAIIFVLTPKGEIIPACCNFRTTKSSAFHAVTTHLDEQKSDASDDGVHADWLAAVTLEDYLSKAKLESVITHTTVERVDAKLAAKLAARFGDKQFISDLSKCVTSIKARHAAVEAKLIN